MPEGMFNICRTCLNYTSFNSDFELLQSLVGTHGFTLVPSRSVFSQLATGQMQREADPAGIKPADKQCALLAMLAVGSQQWLSVPVVQLWDDNTVAEVSVELNAYPLFADVTNTIDIFEGADDEGLWKHRR